MAADISMIYDSSGLLPEVSKKRQTRVPQRSSESRLPPWEINVTFVTFCITKK